MDKIIKLLIAIIFLSLIIIVLTPKRGAKIPELFVITGNYQAYYEVQTNRLALGAGQEINVTVNLTTSGETFNSAVAILKWNPDHLQYKDGSTAYLLAKGQFISSPLAVDPNGSRNFLAFVPAGDPLMQTARGIATPFVRFTLVAKVNRPTSVIQLSTAADHLMVHFSGATAANSVDQSKADPSKVKIQLLASEPPTGTCSTVGAKQCAGNKVQTCTLVDNLTPAIRAQLQTLIAGIPENLRPTANQYREGEVSLDFIFSEINRILGATDPQVIEIIRRINEANLPQWAKTKGWQNTQDCGTQACQDGQCATGSPSPTVSASPSPSPLPSAWPPSPSPGFNGVNICRNLEPQRPAAARGQTLTFACQGWVEDPDHHADFRVQYRPYGSTTFTELTKQENVRDSVSNHILKATYQYTVPANAADGDYLVQCRLCTPHDICTQWGSGQWGTDR